MAIAWMYRADYARAGYCMLSVVDTDGRRTGGAAVRHTLALIAFSLTPFVLGLVGRVYLVGALFFGVLGVAAALSQFVRLAGQVKPQPPADPDPSNP